MRIAAFTALQGLLICLSFHHFRLGGSWLFPNNKDLDNLDTPSNNGVFRMSKVKAEDALRRIEIETAAHNRLFIALLSALNAEQRNTIHGQLESLSLHLVNQMKDGDVSLYDREQAIRQHTLDLLGKAGQ